MPALLKARATQNEIADYIYQHMNVHDASAIPTARQFADGWGAAIMCMADRFGIDCTAERYATITKLANHFGVTRYHMESALRHCKITGKTIAGTSKTTYSLQDARAALETCGHLGKK